MVEQTPIKGRESVDSDPRLNRADGCRLSYLGAKTLVNNTPQHTPQLLGNRARKFACLSSTLSSLHRTQIIHNRGSKRALLLGPALRCSRPPMTFLRNYQISHLHALLLGKACPATIQRLASNSTSTYDINHQGTKTKFALLRQQTEPAAIKEQIDLYEKFQDSLIEFYGYYRKMVKMVANDQAVALHRIDQTQQ